jgi:hypothetical protein
MEMVLIVLTTIVVLAVHAIAKPEMPKPIPVYVPPKPKRKRGVKNEVDPNVKVAQKTLVSFGFTATEAKKLLEGVSASTAEEYVTKAMKKVKV